MTEEINRGEKTKIKYRLHNCLTEKFQVIYVDTHLQDLGYDFSSHLPWSRTILSD